MKLKTPLSWLTAAALAFSMASCGDDTPDWPTVDGNPPTVTLESESITAAPGTTFQIKATVTDADGISEIQLHCPGLFLEKTISITDIYGEPLKEYNLDYKVNVDASEVADSFEVNVTATDVAGKSTTAVQQVEIRH